MKGFTLLETLVALVLIGVGVLAVAPMFMAALEGNASGSEFGRAGALALDRMERLRQLDYDDVGLAGGGSLTSNATGYFDTSDPDYIVRWQILTGPRPLTKIVNVRAAAVRDGDTGVGARRQVTLTTLRGA